MVRGFKATTTLDNINFSLTNGFDASLRGAQGGRIDLVNNKWMTYEALYNSQPWVRAAVDVLAFGIGRLPWDAYINGGRDGEREKQRDGYLANLLQDPGNGNTPTYVKQSIMGNLAVHGNAICVKGRPGPGMPPDTLIPSNFGFWYVVPGIDRPVDWYVFRTWRGMQIPFRPEEVIHFRPWGTGQGLVAPSKMEALRTTLMNEDAAQRMTIASFENGMRPIGAYTVEGTLKPENADRIRAQLNERYGGVDNAFKIMLLDQNAKWQSMSQSFIDSELSKLRTLNREECAAVFAVPQPIMGILDHATFSNVAEQHLMLYMDTYNPWTTLIEESFTVQMINSEPTMEGQYVEFNYKEVMRGNPETEGRMLMLAVGGPFMTSNEARARQNLQPLEVEDSPYGDKILPPPNASPGSATELAGYGDPQPPPPPPSAPAKGAKR